MKRFQSGHITDEASGEDTDSRLSRKALLVYEGTFQSMDGEVTLSAEDIKTIADNYNSGMAKLARLFKGGGAKVQIPVQLDHSPKASDTIGRVEGGVELGKFTDEDGVDKAALYGTLCFIGKDNVEKAKDGRWTHLSIGLEKESKLTEVSVTPFPAAPHASLLSKKQLGTGELDMGYAEHKKLADKYAKCKKHLMEHQGLSEEESDKKLSEAKEEDLSRMEKEHDERLKKLSEEKESPAAKELAKYKADRVELKREQEAVRLAQKKLNISVRLSKLRAQGKVTPAEIKKIDVASLAKGSDESLETAFKLYDARQPVIMAGQHGSTKATDPSKIAADMKRLKVKQMEAESRANMPFTGTSLKNQEQEKKRLAGGTVAMPGGPANSDHMSDVTAMPGGEANSDHMADKPSHPYEGMEADYETMHKLMAEGKHDEAKEHFAKMHEKMKAHLAGPEEEHPLEGVEHHMKEVEDTQKALAKRLETVTI